MPFKNAYSVLRIRSAAVNEFLMHDRWMQPMDINQDFTMW